MLKASARYFDGNSSRVRAVTLDVTDVDLMVTDELGSELARWPLEALRDETHPPSEVELNLSISSDHEARIIVEETDFIKALVQMCPLIRKRRKGPPGWWKPVAAWTAAVVISVTLFFIYGLPLLSYQIASLVPYETRAKIGEEVEGAIIRQFKSRPKNKSEEQKDPVCKGKAGQQALEKLLAQFTALSDVDMPPVKVTVIDSKLPNAFAIPGGWVIIMSSLLDIAEDPNALAGILAHEFGHVEHKHPMSLFVTNIGIAALFSVALGDVSGGTIIAFLGQHAAGAAYSRDYEQDADNRSISLMRELGYDIAPLIPLFEKLGEKTPDMGILSVFASHPDMDERVKALQEAGQTGRGKAFTKREWNAIRVMCKNSV